ncbi:MAG: hypothetical protein LBB29_00200, partial [Holosporaceae bacterium]|nr:hypothetical protein [Holosporaceae bacterium]
MIKRFLELIYNIHFIIYLGLMVSLLLLLYMITCDVFGLHCEYMTTDYVLFGVTATVLGIAFLIAIFLRRKKAMYSDILEESLLYNGCLSGNIVSALFMIIRMIYLYFSGADKLEILGSVLCLCGLFFSALYL